MTLVIDIKCLTSLACGVAALCCLAGCTSVGPTSSEGAPPPQVVAGGETLEGAYFGPTVADAVFKGMPYAAPPVGDLRWRPPQSHQPRPGVQQAVEFSAACMQPGWNVGFARNIATTFGSDPDLVTALGEISEDCLFLNVWTPNLGGTEALPVMVWIHGGANVAGAGSETTYDGANLAAKGVVLVTINYRLNIFGFFAHPALSEESERDVSGNYGLLDQVAALEWVQRNIAAFGGDPTRVTIFGESAGATDVGYLLVSPLAEGLFHRAISQSGGYPVADFRTQAEGEARGVQIATALEIADDSDQLSALRGMAGETLFAETFKAFPLVKGLAPHIDGWVLPEAPGRIFKAGKQHDVPLLIGVNSNEWTTLRYFTPDLDVNSFQAVLAFTYGAGAEKARAMYPVANPEDLQGALDNWLTDLYFVGPSKLLARYMGKVASPTYFYVFSRTLAGPGGADLGAYHAAEMAYAFANLDTEPWVPREAYDGELAEMISSYWVQFATSGDPNHDGQPNWPVYTAQGEEHLEFGDEVTAKSGFRRQLSEIYDPPIEKRLRN